MVRLLRLSTPVPNARSPEEGTRLFLAECAKLPPLVPDIRSFLKKLPVNAAPKLQERCLVYDMYKELEGIPSAQPNARNNAVLRALQNDCLITDIRKNATDRRARNPVLAHANHVVFKCVVEATATSHQYSKRVNTALGAKEVVEELLDAIHDDLGDAPTLLGHGASGAMNALMVCTTGDVKSGILDIVAASPHTTSIVRDAGAAVDCGRDVGGARLGVMLKFCGDLPLHFEPAHYVTLFDRYSSKHAPPKSHQLYLAGPSTGTGEAATPANLVDRAQKEWCDSSIPWEASSCHTHPSRTLPFYYQFFTLVCAVNRRHCWVAQQSTG